MPSASSSSLSAQGLFDRIWSECPADTHVKLPWETGFWKEFFSGPQPPKDLRDWKTVEPPLFIPCISSEPVAECKKLRRTPPESWHHVVASGAEQGWRDKREADFQVSLRRWHDVILGLPAHLIVVQQLSELRTVHERLRMLRDIFAKKAPATLRKRVNSFVRFVAHLASRGIIFPGTESDFYFFLDAERNSGVPSSRIQSIIQSLLFVQHVIGVQDLEGLTSSRRCRGVSGGNSGGPKRQADPFRLVDLQALHSVLVDNSRDLWDRCMAGMVLLTVYCRSRWNDIQQAEDLTLDVDQFGAVAYAELKISEHKTKHSSAFRDTYLHACAPGLGVVDEDWITVWTQVREALGVSFERGHATMPAPLEDGSVSVRPLSTSEMKEWTLMLLRSADIDVKDRRVTSHSCKCTLLSWCSKRGLPWEDRLVLGGHTSNVRSAMVYSRDALGRPLRLLERLLKEIRTGKFLPDATRSGRFPGGHDKPLDERSECQSEFSYEPSLGFGDDSEIKGAEVVEEPAAADGGEVKSAEVLEESATAEPLAEVATSAPPEAVSIKMEQPEASWSLVGSGMVIDLESDADVESEAVDTTSSSSDESGAELGTARRVVQRPRVPRSLKLIQHRKLKTLHLMEQQNQRIMLCGRVADPSRYDNVAETRFDTPCCHVCWRKISEYD